MHTQVFTITLPENFAALVAVDRIMRTYNVAGRHIRSVGTNGANLLFELLISGEAEWVEEFAQNYQARLDAESLPHPYYDRSVRKMPKLNERFRIDLNGPDFIDSVGHLAIIMADYSRARVRDFEAVSDIPEGSEPCMCDVSIEILRVDEGDHIALEKLFKRLIPWLVENEWTATFIDKRGRELIIPSESTTDQDIADAITPYACEPVEPIIIESTLSQNVSPVMSSIPMEPIDILDDEIEDDFEADDEVPTDTNAKRPSIWTDRPKNPSLSKRAKSMRGLRILRKEQTN